MRTEAQEHWMHPFFKLLMAFCVIVCHAVVFAHANVNVSAEMQVERLLTQCCLQTGYNKSLGCLVAIGTVSRDVGEVPDASNILLLRNSMMQEADLLARKNLIISFATAMRAREYSAINSEQGRIDWQMFSCHEIYANEVLDGCATLCCAESYLLGTYQVAVAVAWGRNGRSIMTVRDKVLVAHEDAIGEDDEWVCFAKSIDLATTVGSMTFFDRKGVLRFAGIGCADIDELEDSSLRLQLAKKLALTSARGNLSLAICANIQAGEILLRNSVEKRELEKDLKGRLTIWLRDITRKSNKQTACAPEVYSTIVVHPITKRRIFVSVCGYEPWQLAALGIFDRRTLKTPMSESQPQKSEIESSGVMLWNPNTGKFEKR